MKNHPVITYVGDLQRQIANNTRSRHYTTPNHGFIVRPNNGGITPIPPPVFKVSGNSKRKDDGSFTELAQAAKKKIVGRGSANTGRSSGFIKRGRKVKRTRKALKKNANQIIHHSECGSLTTEATGQMRGLGHATHPIEECIKQAWTALTRLLFKLTGAIPPGVLSLSKVAAGDKIVVGFTNVNNGPIIEESQTLVAGQTIESLVSWLNGTARNYNSTFSGSDPKEIVMHYLAYRVGTNTWMHSAMIDLTKAKAIINSKSTLKIQNRSTDAIEDTNMDDVDNVPVYGKTYTGTGTGLKSRLSLIENDTLTIPTRKDIPSSLTTGVISYVTAPVSSGTLTFGQEPFSPLLYQNVKMCGKVRIEPGYIKTSSLTASIARTISELIVARPILVTGPTREVCVTPFGKYRMMAFEKMIDVSASALGMKFGWELNTKWTTSIRMMSATPAPYETFSKTYQAS